MGKNVIERGWHLAYLPLQLCITTMALTNTGQRFLSRAAGVASILRELQMSPLDTSYQNIHMRRYLAPVIILSAKERQTDDIDRLDAIISGLAETQPIFVVVNNRVDLSDDLLDRATFISRDDINVHESDSFRSFSRKLLASVERYLDVVVDALSFVDLSYCEVDLDYVELARSSLFEQGRNGVVPAWRDFGNFWMNDNGRFIELDVSFDQKGAKSAIYRSALGQGGCIRAWAIRGQSHKLEIDEFITTDDIGLIRRFEFD